MGPAEHVHVQDGHGQAYTQHVIDSIGPSATPRMRAVMSSLIQHLHDFAREVDLNNRELTQAVEFLGRAGQASRDGRGEVQGLCDIVGLSILVDELSAEQAREASKTHQATNTSAVQGPMFRPGAPVRENGSNISFNSSADAVPVYVHGRITDSDSGEPLAGAVVDFWEANTNGAYENLDPEQADYNLRGKFVTDAEGRYSFYCIRPTAYGFPHEGPCWDFLQLLDRDGFRPAHFHFIIEAEGFHSLTTQLFDKDTPALDADTVFAVKNDLIVEFQPRENDPQAGLELEYNVQLRRAF